MRPALYICATPIGNLQDVSFRLIETLKTVKYVLCEDTRVTRVLLSKYAIDTDTISFDQFRERRKDNWVIDQMAEGHSLALVSDAGTPCISDPGYFIVSRVRESGFDVISVPGPSAVSALLSIAGVAVDRYVFSGFTPKRLNDWRPLCELARQDQLPLVFFESPHRIQLLIQWVAEWDPLAHLVLGKELTKKFEEVVSGTSEQLAGLPYRWDRGEWCGLIVFSPFQPSHNSKNVVTQLRECGCSNRQIVDICKKVLHINKNEIYKFLLLPSEGSTDD